MMCWQVGSRNVGEMKSTSREHAMNDTMQLERCRIAEKCKAVRSALLTAHPQDGSGCLCGNEDRMDTRKQLTLQSDIESQEWLIDSGQERV